MKKLTYLFLACTLFVFSCNCNDDDAITVDLPIPATDYYPLTVGSYWVYSWVKFDTLGNEFPYATDLDSVYISGDTLINGLTYAIMEGTHFGGQIKQFYRDSSGFIVDEKGGIPLFSTDADTDLLGYDTIFIGPDPLIRREFKMQPSRHRSRCLLAFLTIALPKLFI